MRKVYIILHRGSKDGDTRFVRRWVSPRVFFVTVDIRDTRPAIPPLAVMQRTWYTRYGYSCVAPVKWSDMLEDGFYVKFLRYSKSHTTWMRRLKTEFIHHPAWKSETGDTHD